MYNCPQLFKHNKFNYLYANVNRSAGSSLTPWGVDDQTNPSRLPASHKESILPPTKLAHPNTGQLSSSGNSRVPNRPPTHHTPSTTTPSIQLSNENHTMVSQEVQKLLIKGAIVETTLSPASFISQIFLIKKKGGRYRPVINLKFLNQFVWAEHFKKEGLHLLLDLIQQGDWIMKLDQKDAYLQIPIHPGHQPLLQIIWEEKYYRFQCLSFGLSAAPRVSTKLLKPVVGFLRQTGLRIIIYLDDMLFMHASKEQTGSDGPRDLQAVRRPGIDGQYEKIPSDSNTDNRVCGVLNQLLYLNSLSTIKEEQENTARSTDTPQMPNRTCKGPGNVYRESCGDIQSPSTGPTLLQSPTEGPKLTTGNTSGPPSGVTGEILNPDCHRRPHEE